MCISDKCKKQYNTIQYNTIPYGASYSLDQWFPTFCVAFLKHFSYIRQLITRQFDQIQNKHTYLFLSNYSVYTCMYTRKKLSR